MVRANILLTDQHFCQVLVHLGDETYMDDPCPKLKFQELKVGTILKSRDKLLQIVEIDYRRQIVYYYEIDSDKKNQGSFTESSYLLECQKGNIHAVQKTNLTF